MNLDPPNLRHHNSSMPNDIGMGGSPRKIDMDPMAPTHDAKKGGLLGSPGISPRLSPNKGLDDAKKTKTTEGDDGDENIEGLQNDGEASSSGGVFISVLINVLFIVSFLMEFRIEDASKMNFAIQQEFDQYPISTNPQMFLSDLSKIEEVMFFINSVVFDNLLNPNRTYTPLKYQSLLNQSVNVDWYKNTSSGGSSSGGDTGDEEEEQDEDLTKKFYSEENSYYFFNSFNLFKGMHLTATYNENYEYDDNEELPTDVYLYATISQKEAKDALSVLLDRLTSGYIVSLQMDTIFFNVITQIGLYYDIEFEQADQSNFKVLKNVKPFFPKTFDSDFEDTTAQVLIIIFRVLFALALLFRILKIIIIDLYKAIKTFFQTQKLDLPFSLIFNICVVGLLTLILVLSVVQTFTQLNTFKTFDIIDLALFEDFIGDADFLAVFLRLLAITVCLLIVQILLLLNTQFPTFGVLFYTLGNSKNKLLIYGVLVVTLMAGFIVFLTLNFGPYDADMSDFGSSLLLIFEFMIGVVDLDKLNQANEYLAWIYFFVFYLLFNLLVLLLFIVIIISTYVQLRKKLQLTTLALAELAAEKSNKLKEKYIRLFLFKPPPEEERGDEEVGSKIKRGTTKKKSNIASQKKKKSPIEILLYNLEEVDWFGFTNNNRQTRDEIEEEIRNKIADIKYRKMQQKKKKMADRRSELFDKIANMAFYVVFIVIYTYALTFELKIEASFELNKTMENYYINTKFRSQSGLNKTFYEISTLEDIVRWTRDAYLGRIYSGFTNPTQTDTSILLPYDQNAIVTSSISRINFRNLKTSQKNNSTGTATFTVPSDTDIFPGDAYSTLETIDDISTPDGLLFKQYTFSGTYETFRQNGGYVWIFNRNLDDARKKMAEIQHPRVLNINTALVSLQTVYTNRNYQILGMSEFTMEIDKSGDVDKRYKTKALQIDLYSCDNCRAKLAFEILYLLLIIKQTFDIIKAWLYEWKDTSKITPVNETLRNGPWYVKFFNYDVENMKFFPFIFAVGRRIWQFLNRVFVTTTNMFKSNYANLVLTLSLILTYISFYFYFSIIAQANSSSFNINQAFFPSTNMDTEIGKYENLAILYENYALIQAFNAWLIILRILFQYGFSKELSLVIELIYEALFDIIFFTAMFVIILLGFAIDGYLLFGTEAKSFTNVSQSLLQVLLMMISGESPSDLVVIDKITRAVYFILLVVVCLLILLKMFIAILDGHFTDLTSDSGQKDDLGVFELIVSIVVEKVKTAKIDDSVETASAGDGKLKKLRIKITNGLRKVRSKILKALRRVIFGSDDEGEGNAEEERAEMETEKRRIEMNLNFGEKEEDRRADLQDIEIYLKAGKNKRKDPQMPMESVENEDALSVPSKWMNYLEESVSRITNGKINLAKFGTGAKDYLSAEIKLDPDLVLKLNEIEKQCDRDRPKDIPLTDYYLEHVALKDYNTNLLKKFKGQMFYERVIEHINFIYHKSCEKEDQKAPLEFDDSDSKSEIVEEIVTQKFSRTSFRPKTLVQSKGGYKEAKFSDSGENLLRFWEKLKFKHRFELWGGERADLMSNDIRHCLWRQMKFEGETFGPHVPKEIFETKGLNPAKIGLPELECIWNVAAGEENDDNATKDNYGEKQTGTPFVPKHIDIVEYVIRENFENIVFELRKFETTEEKINFLRGVKTVKNDEKLMLWLLTSPSLKMEMTLRIQNEILADFTMLMLMEEVYDNTYLVQKLEKELDHDMRNRVYMHFFFFANYEASQHSLMTRKDDYLPEQDPDLLEYIGFLEGQLRSTNDAKKKCLDEIQKVIKKEDAMKSQFELSKLEPSAPLSIDRVGGAVSQTDEEKDMLIRRAESGLSGVESGTDNKEEVSKSAQNEVVDEEEEENVQKEEDEKKEIKVEAYNQANIDLANARAKRLEKLKKANK